MSEKKKTVENPPIRLQQEVIKNSKSNVYKDAVSEWEFYRIYDTEETKSCLCSPREIRYVVVIKNKYTDNNLEICNRCAELYFNITDGQQIADSIRKLKKNINLNMNRVTLDYLLKNKVIDEVDYNNVEIAWLKRESEHPYSKEINAIRAKINTKFLSFTNYENKRFFNTADYMLGSSKSYRRLDPNLVITEREKALSTGRADVDVLYYIMDEYSGDGADYDEKERNRLLDGYFRKTSSLNLTRYLDPREYYERITDFSPFGGMPKPKRRERKINLVTDIMLEGLEDGIIDLNDNIDYEDDWEWEDSHFEEDEFALKGGEKLILSFINFIFKWLQEEIRKHDTTVQNSSKESTNQTTLRSYPIEQILEFVNVEVVTEIFESNKNGIHSFYELMVEKGLSIKYAYVILDKLIRRTDIKTRNKKLGILKRMLFKNGFVLVHDDKITRIEMDQDYKNQWSQQFQFSW